MGGSTTVSSSISSSLSTCSSGQRNCIERSTTFEALQQKVKSKRSPRFFFWTLNFGNSNKNKDKNNRPNSNESTPRSPDSSRSVKFEAAESWPWIDDDYSVVIEKLGGKQLNNICSVAILG
ncbi:hypothetical protein ACQ4LE_001200 [Meloidogyne hapla]|uniref:Uncharacterized protein n=1 Tax=Meloidogyne hapla TaxID=6305 RepID=A0A1I8BJS0_MELHA